MKAYLKPISISIIVVSLSCISFGQDFAPIGAKWYYSNRESPFMGPMQGYLLVESIADTIILGKSSRLLKNTYYSSDGDTIDEGFEIVYSENNQVHYIKYDRSFLLYDFGANEGDTLIFQKPFFYGHQIDSTFQMIVESVDSLKIESIYLKSIHLRDLSGTYDLYTTHVEKIGNIPYMFPQQGLACDAACWDPFRCYIDDSINYSNPGWGYSCDELITSDINYYSPRFKVFPNPAGKKLSIESMEIMKSPCFIKIYDSSGRCVKSIIGKSTITKMDIDVSSLPSGLYFIEVNASWREKLIKL